MPSANPAEHPGTSAADVPGGIWRSPWTRIVTLYAGLALVWAWPLLPALASALPNDLGDPALNTWILWWNAHAVPLSARWWNAPAFFPAPSAFALSESLLGLTVVTTPLQWLGASPVVAYNLSFLLSVPFAAVAAHLLAYRLTRRHDAALIAALAFAFSPGRLAQLPHIQSLWSGWMPLSLFALHWFLEKRRPRALVLLGVCWMMNGFSNGYYLFFLPVLVGAWMVWCVRRWRDAMSIGLTLVIATLPLLPLLLGYRERQAAFGLTRGLAEIESFSADVTAFWATSPTASIAHHWTLNPGPEGDLYPGLTILLLVAAGLMLAWRGRTRVVGGTRWLSPVLFGLAVVSAIVGLVAFVKGGWSLSVFGVPILSTHRPRRVFTVTLWLSVLSLLTSHLLRDVWRRRSMLVFYAGAAVLMAIFALGPTARVAGTKFWWRAPYTLLMFLPGGHSLRVPARFGVLTGLCLGIAGALAFARLARSRPRYRVAAVLGAAIFLEGWTPRMPIAHLPPPLRLPGLDTRAAVFEVPLVNYEVDTIAMFHGTQHGHPVVNGMSGYGAPHYTPLANGVREGDPAVFAALQEWAPIAVYIDPARDVDGSARQFVALAPDARPFGPPFDNWFLLPMRPARPPEDAGVALPIAALTGNRNTEALRLMLDGNYDTRWTTLAAQIPGDAITIDFGHEVTVRRIEMGMGTSTGDYPRLLEVSIPHPTGAPSIVWTGSLAGRAVAATLQDPLHIAITVDLPSPVAGRYLTLTNRGSTPEMYWSIAELRAFGQ